MTCYSCVGGFEDVGFVVPISHQDRQTSNSHEQNFSQPTEVSHAPLNRLKLSRQCPVCVDVASAVA